MGASRESFKISHRWKWGGKTFSEKLRSMNTLMIDVMLNKNYRKLFITDNYTQPFNKLIGCKVFGHKYRHDYEDPEYFCTKCWHRISEEKHDGMIRRKKLLRIKRKI